MPPRTSSDPEATARQLAEALGPEVSVGKPITVQGQTIVPLVRVQVSAREASLSRRFSGSAVTARWESEPVGLVVLTKGRKPELFLLPGAESPTEKKAES